MKMIYLVTVQTPSGDEFYYAGAENEADAFLLAARAGHEGDTVTVKHTLNKHGIKPGDFKRAR